MTDPIAQRVALRFRDQRGESKKHKVQRLRSFISDQTGLSRGVSEQIADAFVRGRDVERLAPQKRWPLEGQEIQGPKGNLSLTELATESDNTRQAALVYDDSRDAWVDPETGEAGPNGAAY